MSDGFEFDFTDLDDEQSPHLHDYYDDALKGDAYAQYVLGQMFETGHNVAVDYEQARHWYTQVALQWLKSSAKQCHPPACYDYALSFGSGSSFPRVKPSTFSAGMDSDQPV